MALPGTDPSGGIPKIPTPASPTIAPPSGGGCPPGYTRSAFGCVPGADTPGPVPAPTPAGGTPGAGDFGTGFKPWETIDTTISQGQWQAWEKFRDPSCPPNRPYKSERGEAGCFEKPVDCPDGMMPGGPGAERCIPNPKGMGGGAGGPGGGGGGAAGPMGSSLGALFGPGSPGFDTENLINQKLREVIEGKTRFSPEVMAALAGQSKAVEQARIKRETEAGREDQAARGVAFSPVGAGLESDIRQQAASEYDQAIRMQQVQKAVTDFDDHMQALSQAQQWLNSLRSYALGLDSNNVQREGIAANVMIAREGISAEMQRLMASIGANQDLQNQQIDFNKWLFFQQNILCANLGKC